MELKLVNLAVLKTMGMKCEQFIEITNKNSLVLTPIRVSDK